MFLVFLVFLVCLGCLFIGFIPYRTPDHLADSRDGKTGYRIRQHQHGDRRDRGDTAAVVQGSAEHGSVLRLGVFGAGAAVGMLPSAIPYRMEPDALRRIRSAGLAAREWAAIACVMVACAGAARGAAERDLSPEGASPPPAR